MVVLGTLSLTLSVWKKKYFHIYAFTSTPSLMYTDLLIHRRAHANTTPLPQPQIFYLKTLVYNHVALPWLKRDIDCFRGVKSTSRKHSEMNNKLKHTWISRQTSVHWSLSDLWDTLRVETSSVFVCLLYNKYYSIFISQVFFSLQLVGTMDDLVLPQSQHWSAPYGDITRYWQRFKSDHCILHCNPF